MTNTVAFKNNFLGKRNVIGHKNISRWKCNLGWLAAGFKDKLQIATSFEKESDKRNSDLLY